MSHLQQCGYECKCFSLLNNLFSCFNQEHISSLQSLTNLPAHGSTSSTNFPDLLDGAVLSRANEQLEIPLPSIEVIQKMLERKTILLT